MTGVNDSSDSTNLQISRSPDAEPPWYAPFRRFMKYIDETETLVRLHIHSVHRALAWPGFLSEALKVPEDEEMLVAARKTASDAQREVDRGFPLLHAHALVGLWSALEAAIEDISVAWLVAKPEILLRPEFSKIRVPIAEYLFFSVEDQMSYLTAEVQRDLKVEFKQGVTRFEKVLDALDMGGTVPEKVRRAIYEAQQMRNCLAHRGKYADRRLVESCPWLKLEAGQELLITHKKFEYYLRAIQMYCLILLNRFRSVDGTRPLTVSDYPPLMEFAKDIPELSQEPRGAD